MYMRIRVGHAPNLLMRIDAHQMRIIRMNRINSKKKSSFLDQNFVILDFKFSFLRMDKTKWDEQ